jgi:hypothetical protein
VGEGKEVEARVCQPNSGGKSEEAEGRFPSSINVVDEGKSVTGGSGETANLPFLSKNPGR